MAKRSKVRWGILGPGTIARTFAGGVAHSKRGKLVAIGARNPDRAEYAEHFPGARVLAGLRGAARRPRGRGGLHRDAAPEPRRVGDRAAEAGKHVLCEKPLGLTAYEADAMIHAARKAGTFLGEAFMYRVHPQTARLLELIRERRDRRGAGDQVELRLRDAAVRPRAPALRQRPRRRRHPRRRLLPGVDGAADRRGGRGPAVPRAGEGGGRGASRRDRGRRVGGGAARSSRTASSPRSPARCRSPRTTCSGCSAPRGGSRSPTSGSPPATRAAPAGSR